MSELITDEIFSDGQENINASNINGIIGKARLQPDAIANKPASAASDIADLFLVLKTNNTLASTRFDTITNSVASQLPLADNTRNGTLRQVSGKASDFVDGTNNCQPVSNLLPPGMIIDFSGSNIPAGWLLADGSSKLRTDYPGLFLAIGTTYGSVDSTHFNVPDFTGLFAAGAGGSVGTLGTAGGSANVALGVANLPAHTHPITDLQHSHLGGAHSHTIVTVTGAGSQIASGSGWTLGTGTTSGPSATTSGPNFTGITATQATGSGTAVPILPPYRAVNKLIKT